MNVMALIDRELAKPMTHVVLTTYADGRIHRFEARSVDAAGNYATGDRRKIGRKLIDRATGNTVEVVGVEVVAIA